MFEPGIDHFFDAAQLGAPKIAHFVEAAVHGVEAPVHMGS
jgi:hypothetical protein